jgi:hypothetical protein
MIVRHTCCPVKKKSALSPSKTVWAGQVAMCTALGVIDSWSQCSEPQAAVDYKAASSPGTADLPQLGSVFFGVAILINISAFPVLLPQEARALTRFQGEPWLYPWLSVASL